MTSFALLLDIDPRYMVDSDGNVYGPKSVLKPTPRVNGKYLQVSIGESKHYVHRLIAGAFLANPEGKPDVAHWDNNGLNDRVENLRWATESENAADKKMHGTINSGVRNGHARLTDADVEYIRGHRGTYRGVQRHLAYAYGVAESVISNVMRGKTYPELDNERSANGNP